MNRTLGRMVLKLVSGHFEPDTGLTVQLKTDEGSPVLLGTATESPSGSGQYTLDFTSTEKWGFWYVGGTKKSEWGQVWLGTEGGTGLGATGAANQLAGMNAAANAFEWKTLTATTNRVSVTHGTGTITLSTPQDIHTGASPAFLGLNLSGLTASRLMASDGSKNLASVADLTAWVAGTANRVTVSSDGDGSLTLSGPQDIHTTAQPTFFKLTLVGTNPVLSFNDNSGSNYPWIAFQLDGSTKAYVGVARATDHLITGLLAGGLGLRTQSTMIAMSVDGGSNAHFRLDTSGNIMPKSYADLSLPSTATTGFKLTQAGEGYFKYLYTDELHAKSFIADLEQALAGGQIICKSVAKLAADFTAPYAGDVGPPDCEATLVVESFAGFPSAKVFVNGDVVRIRNFSRTNLDLTITDCWGTVTWVSTDTNARTQTYTLSRSYSPNQGGMSQGAVVKAGALALDYGTTGNGYYEVNAIDGASAANSPYAQILTWTGHPNSGMLLRGRYGNLAGVTDSAFGPLSGFGLYTQNAYLTGNCQVVGNLTVGGENKVGNTFYAGKIYKNFLPANSEKFGSGNGWTDPGSSGITITDTYDDSGTASCPSPTGIVSRWVLSGGTNKYRYAVSAVDTATRTVCFSIWARGASGGEQIVMQAAEWGSPWETPINQTKTLTTAWVRYWGTGTFATGQDTDDIYVTLNMVANGTVYFWGAQIELGSVPTVYQPTDGSVSLTNTQVDTKSYGMWAISGGFGGTIQNPVVNASSVGLSVGSYVIIGNNLDPLVAYNRLLIGLQTTEDPIIRLQGYNKAILLGIDSSANSGQGAAYFGMHDAVRYNLRVGELSVLGGSGFGFELLDSAGSSVFAVKSSGDAQICGWGFNGSKFWKGATAIDSSVEKFISGNSGSDSSGTGVRAVMGKYDGTNYGIRCWDGTDTYFVLSSNTANNRIAGFSFDKDALRGIGTSALISTGPTTTTRIELQATTLPTMKWIQNSGGGDTNVVTWKATVGTTAVESNATFIIRNPSDSAMKTESYYSGYYGQNSSGERYYIGLNGSVAEIRIHGTKVVDTRKTGWGAPTGTATRTTFNTGTIGTTDLAERVKALIDDLTSHGLIGS